MLKKIIIFFIGIIISGIFLFLAFKNVPFNELLKYLSNINYLYISTAVLLVMVSFLLRAVRWRILMNNKIDFASCFHIIMTGFMLNSIMPARAGEIARPLLAIRNKKVGFAEAAASVAVERLFDIIVLLFLFIILYSKIEVPDSISYDFGQYKLNKELLESFVSGVGKLFILLFIFLVIAAVKKTRDFILSFLNFIGNFFQINLVEQNSISKKNADFILKIMILPLKKFIEGFSSGLNVIKTFSSFLKVIILSFGVWLIQAVSYFVVLIGIQGVEGSVEIGFTEITFIMLIICFFIAIPSVPGFWGVWEAGGIFAMMIFGVSKIDAAGYNLINHGVQIFPVIITGLFSAWFIGFSSKVFFNNV